MLDDAEDVDADSLSFSVASNGAGVLTWLQDDNDSSSSVYASTYENGRFNRAERVQTEDRDRSSDPDVGVGSNGDALVVWSADDSGEHIFANVGDAESSDGDWDSRAMQVEDGNEDAEKPQVAVNRSGQGVAIWVTQDGELWGSLYRYDNRLVSLPE